MKTAATVKKNRSRRSLSKTDRFTLATFVGIPTLLQIILLWVPESSQSFFLSHIGTVFA